MTDGSNAGKPEGSGDTVRNGGLAARADRIVIDSQRLIDLCRNATREDARTRLAMKKTRNSMMSIASRLRRNDPTLSVDMAETWIGDAEAQVRAAGEGR
jgi:hypothetical protein